MKISIELFKGISQEEIEEKIISLFQEDDEITIVELDTTYGYYMESIEALKDDIASYFNGSYSTQYIDDIRAKARDERGEVSICYFEGVAPEKINGMLEDIWDPSGQITIIELGATYKNNPESIAKLKEDIRFYNSARSEEEEKETPKAVGSTAVLILLRISIIGIIAGILAIIWGVKEDDKWLIELGVMDTISCIIYACLFNYILDLGMISQMQEKRISALEKKINGNN